MLKPLGENVILKLNKEIEKTKSGIILGDNSEDKVQTAQVIAIGDGCEKIKYGQKVIFNKYSGLNVNYENIEYLIVKYEDILAILE